MRILPPRLAFAQVVEAQIGNDPVNPGIERAFKTKVTDMPVSFEEGFLIDVLRVGFRAGEVKRKAQDRLIILPDKRLKRTPVTALRGTNQIAVIQSALSLTHYCSRSLGVSFCVAPAYRNRHDCCVGRHQLCPRNPLCFLLLGRSTHEYVSRD